MNFDFSSWQIPEWGLAIAFLTLLVTVGVPLIIDRARNPRRKVRVEFDVTELLNTRASTPDLKVSVGDDLVEDPHIVEISVAAVGRRDVSSETFDGRPVTVTFRSGEILRNLTPESAHNKLVQVSPTEVHLDPILLKVKGKGDPFVGRFLCAGSPQFSVPQSLRDITIEEIENRQVGMRSDPSSDQHLRRANRVGAAGVIVSTLVGVAALIVQIAMSR